MIGTAIAGPSCWFIASEIASPVAVMRILVAQNHGVISGTLLSWNRRWVLGLIDGLRA